MSDKEQVLVFIFIGEDVMKVVFTLMALLLVSLLGAQPDRVYDRQFRISLDEDFINIRGKGTDKGYTGGLHLDYLYTPQKANFFLERWLPKAGTEAINTYGIGLSHLMFTPTDLSTPAPLPGNYAYAGALFGRYSLNSSNAIRKYNLQSQIVLGVMGPMSLAEDIQIFIHRAIGDEKPMGWDNQLPNDILINFQLSAEKQMTNAGRGFELMGGATASAGSMYNGAGLYLLARAGKMDPYFSGILSQNRVPHSAAKKRTQLYVRVKPMLQIVAYNALLRGGLILNKSRPVSPQIHNMVGSVEYGLTLAHRNFSISFTQTTISPFVEGMDSHETGNISLYFNW